ncbi:MAG: TetR family transcriptional regulator [Rhodospirillaceae bacterium]|nr:TetR family transcriptional regulator [Rhodospirillaceae bacterium]|tara:strand:+ start:1006 stop:1605 length:600 start_codon:yes stop_codon:yes gene_type:complete
MSSIEISTREKILQATLDLLQHEPGVAVRMADIARRAGVSRQALYLHFATRTDLLIATTFHLDALNNSEARLKFSRQATTGLEQLDAFITAWAGHLPEISAVARALLALRAIDDAAAAAWDQRMQDMREGCAAAVEAMHRDGDLTPELSPERAADILWTLLSFQTWDQLTQTCGWTQTAYLKTMKEMARRVLMRRDGTP